MRSRIVASTLISLMVVAPAAAIGQKLSAARAGVTRPETTFGVAAPLRLVPTTDDLPPRWPFVIGGALIGGVVAGAWYAHEVSKSEDAMIDLSVPVVAVGIAAGAFGGFLVGEIVRAAVAPDTSRSAPGARN